MIHSRFFVGLSCGSSGDSIDAVLTEVQGVGLGLSAKLIQTIRRPLSREVVEAMDALHLDRNSHEPVLHRAVGEALLAAANQVLAQVRFEPQRVMAVGVFGPLAWHEPGGRNPSTREYGMVSLLADRLGLTVVSDFREQDVAAGGQGMPQTALADSLLFRTETEDRLLIHLGSVFSVVWLKASKRVQDVLAFESGPGHRLLDDVIRGETQQRERYDPGGRYAVQGRCLESCVEKWLNHPYFSMKPPKSLGRSEFGDAFIQQAIRLAAKEAGTLQDLLCSLSHFLIRALVLSCRRWAPETLNERPVWLSGGGTRNGLLWRLIEQYVPTWKLARLDELGLPALARSAMGAAILASLTLDGVSASTPNATGTVGRMLGRITPGGAANWSKCLRWMLTQSSELVSPYRAA